MAFVAHLYVTKCFPKHKLVSAVYEAKNWGMVVCCQGLAAGGMCITFPAICFPKLSDAWINTSDSQTVLVQINPVQEIEIQACRTCEKNSKSINKVCFMMENGNRRCKRRTIEEECDDTFGDIHTQWWGLLGGDVVARCHGTNELNNQLFWLSTGSAVNSLIKYSVRWFPPCRKTITPITEMLPCWLKVVAIISISRLKRNTEEFVFKSILHSATEELFLLITEN